MQKNVCKVCISLGGKKNSKIDATFGATATEHILKKTLKMKDEKIQAWLMKHIMDQRNIAIVAQKPY